jgi:hypothetical protein
MNEQIDRGGPSSTSASSGPLAEAGSGASSHPTGPAQRPTSVPGGRGRRVGLATATLAALGTLAIAIAAAGGLGGATTTQGAVTTVSAATAAAAQPSPTEQVIVDTVYVRAPAPTAQPPLVVPSKVKATPKPPIKVVQVVPGAGGEHEGAEHEGGQAEAESGGGDD